MSCANRAQGVTVLVVEQSAHVALAIADRAHVLQNGITRLEGPARDLLANAEVRRAYLGQGGVAGRSRR